MTDDEWFEYLNNTHGAVLKFGKNEIQGLVRRAIYRLQRVDASGIYGDAYTYKTLWDEWCHEAQEGPHDLLEEAWNHTLSTYLKDVIDRIPPHTCVLLSKYAQWELGLSFGSELMDLPETESILELLRNRVSNVAGSRSIDHLQP